MPHSLPRSVVATLVAAALAALPGVALATGGTPVLARLAPLGAAPGATLTLFGSGFGPQGPGAQVLFLGQDVTAPAQSAQILSWTATTLRVRVPRRNVWPGIADVEVVNPAVSALASDALPLTVDPGAGAVAGAETSWLPSGAQGAGTLRVGFSDAAGAQAAPLLLTLPTATPGGAAAFTVPTTLPTGDVLVNDVPVASVSVGAASLAWPGGGTASAATIDVWPAAGSAPVPGQVSLEILPGAGLLGPSAGVLPLRAGPATGAVPLTVAIGAGGVAAYRLTAPAEVPAGSPFTVRVQAVGASGQPLSGAAGPVFLGSDGAVDFPGAHPTDQGPTAAEVALHHGGASVVARAEAPGMVRLTASDAAGLHGAARVRVAAPPAGSGLQLRVFPSYSGFQGSSTVATVAALRSLDRRSGATHQGRVFGGFWPLGVGRGYDAHWSGTLTVRAAAALPAPLAQPTLRFALLNVGAGPASATLTPLAGSGASINGSSGGSSGGSGGGVDLATATPGSGWLPPTILTLTPGRYRLSVRLSEDHPGAWAGDTLYYSEAFQTSPSVGTGGAASAFAAPSSGGTAWSPLIPLPPAAFSPAGLAAPALSVPIGRLSVDDAGAPVALPTPAQIVSGRTLLPLRAIAETLGATVRWHPATGGIRVTGPGGAPAAGLTLGSATATVNGNPITLQAPPLLLPPGITLVPLRFLGAALGWGVGWDAATRTAVLLPPLQAALPTLPAGAG